MKDKKIVITCGACKKDRLVSTNGMLKASYEKIHPRCHKCGYNKILSGKTTYVKNDPRIIGNTFCSGLTPWNKGVKGTHFSPSTEFKKGVSRPKEDKSSGWKGDNIGYSGLHAWVYRNLGKATTCSICSDDRKRHVHWANISHQYKRVKTDFIQLCVKHHSAYDQGRITL